MHGKPDDIPQDVWDAGEDHLRRYSYLLISTEIVARAMLAERERCAKLAELEGVCPELNVAGGGPEWYRHAQRTASAIRKGGA